MISSGKWEELAVLGSHVCFSPQVSYAGFHVIKKDAGAKISMWYALNAQLSSMSFLHNVVLHNDEMLLSFEYFCVNIDVTFNKE